MSPDSCRTSASPDVRAITVREGEPGMWVAVPTEHGDWIVLDLLAVDATSLDDFTIDTATTWLRWAIKKLDRAKRPETGAAR